MIDNQVDTLFEKVEKPKNGRRFVVGDIHGCFQTLKELVEEKIQLQREDHLYFLGDYIDRGPSSSGVIDYIIALDNQGFNVFPLRGNHEQDFLENWYFYNNLKTIKNLDNFSKLCRANRVSDLLNEKNELKPKYFHFLHNLKYYFELDDFYLVHAGFNFTHSRPFESWEDMLWIRRFSETELTDNQTNKKRIVVGHSVHRLEEIIRLISEKNRILPIDNGCFYGILNDKHLYMGQYAHLCAVNLDSFELIIQNCVD
jgi:serine/threonine protein phosphatase 1